jgi:hypothetical protein
MVERVAKAMAESVGWPEDMWEVAGDNDTSKKAYRHYAKVAIEAMRSAEFQVRDESGVIHELRGAPMDTWRFLFDAALAPTSPTTT